MSIEVPIIVLILAIPIYFLSKWILKKWNFGNEKNRKYLAIIPSIVLSPIVYIGLIYLWIFSISYYPTNDFDKQTWESNPEERYKMSEALFIGQVHKNKRSHQTKTYIDIIISLLILFLFDLLHRVFFEKRKID